MTYIYEEIYLSELIEDTRMELSVLLKNKKLKIPKTTNSCDGSFAHWKGKIKLHRGLRRDRRNRMIETILAGS